jgi:hypothetical protein
MKVEISKVPHNVLLLKIKDYEKKIAATLLDSIVNLGVDVFYKLDRKYFKEDRRFSVLRIVNSNNKIQVYLDKITYPTLECDYIISSYTCYKNQTGLILTNYYKTVKQ